MVRGVREYIKGLRRSLLELAPMVTHCDVAIVGGGVAGLAAALALSRRGWTSVVLEARRERGDIDRGDVLHSSALVSLSTWGCDDALSESKGLSLSRFSIVDERGRSLAELDAAVDATPSAKLFVLPHSEIEGVLEAVALRTGKVTIRRGERCVSLLEAGGRVVGAVSAAGQVHSQLVLLATGANSLLRRKYFGDDRGRDYPWVYWNLQCVGCDLYRDRAAYVLGRNGVMILVPLPGGHMRLGFQMARSGPAASSFDWAAEAGRRLATLAGAPIRVLSAHRYAASRSLAPLLVRPGAAVIGDAAHTTHPAGAKGMNLAVRDVEVLDQLLAGQILNREVVDQALADYSVVRRSEVQRVLRLTHLLGSAAHVESRLAIGARNAVLRQVARISAVRSAFLSRLCWEC